MPELPEKRVRSAVKRGVVTALSLALLVGGVPALASAADESVPPAASTDTAPTTTPAGEGMFAATALPAAATTVSADVPATLYIGSPVDLDVVVTNTDGGATGPAPAGTVVLVVDGTSGTPVAVTEGTGSSTATLVLSADSLLPGSHDVRVDYLPANSDFDPSSTAAASVTVLKAPSTIISESPAVVYGKTSKIHVTVTGGAAKPTGTVALSAAGTRITSSVLAEGKVTLTVSATLSAGVHRYTVQYLGDSTHETVSGEIALSRSKASPGLKATTTKAVYPGRGTVKVTLTGTGARPTGTVAIQYKGTTVARGTLSAGKATVKLPAKWKPGTRKLAVVYKGNTNYLTKKVSVNQTVTKAKSKVTIGQLPTVAHDRKAVFNVKVTSKAGTPTGTVSVRIGGKLVATAHLKGGRATLKLPIKPIGSYALDVRYLGSSTMATSHATKKMTVKFKLRGAKAFGSGIFKVNSDVQPGLYRVKLTAGKSCGWAKTNSKGESDTVWGVFGYGLMRILTTDKFVRSEGCGTWRLVSETPNWPFTNGLVPGDGTFIIGKDVAPGIYYQANEGCYLSGLHDVTGHNEDVRWAAVTTEPVYVKIVATDFAFETQGCSTLVRVA